MFYLDPYNHSILKNYHRYCSALEFINQYIFKKPMQSEKAYYRLIAGFFNAGRPVATPAGPANLVLKEGIPWYQRNFSSLYRHTAETWLHGY